MSDAMNPQEVIARALCVIAEQEPTPEAIHEMRGPALQIHIALANAGLTIVEADKDDG